MENLKYLREKNNNKYERLKQQEYNKQITINSFSGSPRGAICLELHKKYKIVSFKVTKNEYFIINVFWEEQNDNISGYSLHHHILKQF